MAEINRLANKEDADLSKQEQMEARAQRLFKECDTDGVLFPMAQACMPLVHAARADASEEFQAPVKNVNANSGAFKLRNHALPSLFQIVGNEVSIMLNIRSGRRSRPSKSKPAQPPSPHLPSFAILKECAEAADSPHKTCSACDSALAVSMDSLGGLPVYVEHVPHAVCIHAPDRARPPRATNLDP